MFSNGAPLRTPLVEELRSPRAASWLKALLLRGRREKGRERRR